MYEKDDKMYLNLTLFKFNKIKKCMKTVLWNCIVQYLPGKK